jgi:RNA polymerase sigma-70 factor, ECF subfamily
MQGSACAERARSCVSPGSFDEVILPHLDAASRLARWLLRNDEDAEDVVQEATLRALRYFRTFTGGNARAWFLRIVRNTCSGWRGHGGPASIEPFDEELHSRDRSATDPETLALQIDDVELIDEAMHHLPDRFRQLLVLREVEGLSYRELSAAMHMPMGTVMSGLSRARQALRASLHEHLGQQHPQSSNRVLVMPIAGQKADMKDMKDVKVMKG